jgi:hypothetical protein
MRRRPRSILRGRLHLPSRRLFWKAFGMNALPNFGKVVILARSCNHIPERSIEIEICEDDSSFDLNLDFRNPGCTQAVCKLYYVLGVTSLSLSSRWLSRKLFANAT